VPEGPARGLVECCREDPIAAPSPGTLEISFAPPHYTCKRMLLLVHRVETESCGSGANCRTGARQRLGPLTQPPDMTLHDSAGLISCLPRDEIITKSARRLRELPLMRRLSVTPHPQCLRKQECSIPFRSCDTCRWHELKLRHERAARKNPSRRILLADGRWRAHLFPQLDEDQFRGKAVASQLIPSKYATEFWFYDGRS